MSFSLTPTSMNRSWFLPLKYYMYTKYHILDNLIYMECLDRQIYIESRLAVAQVLGGVQEVSTNGHRIPNSGDKNVQKLFVMLVVQPCDNTINHSVIHFKWVNCMLCEL